MLPSTSTPKPSPYDDDPTALLRRVCSPHLLDFEIASWLVTQFLFHPRSAHRYVSYQRQSRHKWARDDPAFILVGSYIQFAMSTAWCLAFGHGVWGSFLTVISSVVVDYLVAGAG